MANKRKQQSNYIREQVKHAKWNICIIAKHPLGYNTRSFTSWHDTREKDGHTHTCHQINRDKQPHIHQQVNQKSLVNKTASKTQHGILLLSGTTHCGGWLLYMYLIPSWLFIAVLSQGIILNNVDKCHCVSEWYALSPVFIMCMCTYPLYDVSVVLYISHTNIQSRSTLDNDVKFPLSPLYPAVPPLIVI